jgi:hypothetical protein
MKQALAEGIDYYFNEQGYLVFTAKYLLNRGFCCGNGCSNCPYGYINVPEPQRTALIMKRNTPE